MDSEAGGLKCDVEEPGWAWRGEGGGVRASSSSMAASWEPPSTEGELDSGGTAEPDTQLGAGLLSPEAALGGVGAWLCFFLRSVSIQLELWREAKDASASEDRRMFLPDVISSPKPSWWAKA